MHKKPGEKNKYKNKDEDSWKIPKYAEEHQSILLNKSS